MEEEKELLVSLKKGDETAFFDLYKRYKDRVFSLIYNIVKNREKAEDIFQEVFLNVFKNKKRIDSDRPFWPYLRKITLNTTFSWIRREKKTVSIEKVAELLSEDFLLKRMSEKELANKILEKLPSSQRMVIILQKFEGYTIREMAKELKISEKAVESLLSRATKNILKIYLKIEEKKNTLIYKKEEAVQDGL